MGSLRFKDTDFTDLGDRRPGPFGDNVTNYTQVTQYIVDNRGYLLNRHDRKKIPVYLKTGTQIREDDAQNLRMTQTRLKLSGFQHIPEKPSILKKAANVVVDFIGKILGYDKTYHKDGKWSGFDKSYTEINNEDESSLLETRDPNLERIKPLNISKIQNSYAPTYFNRADDQAMIIDERSVQESNKNASRIPLYRGQSNNQPEFLGKRKAQLEHQDSEELERNIHQEQHHHKQKRQRTSEFEAKLINRFSKLQDKKFEKITNSLQGLNGNISELKNTFENRFNTLKDDIIKEVSQEMKGQLLKTWKDGTEKFYNDAKSVVSGYSINGASSVISDLSRSRSASKDFNTGYNKYQINTQSNFGLQFAQSQQAAQKPNMFTKSKPTQSQLSDDDLLEQDFGVEKESTFFKKTQPKPFDMGTTINGNMFKDITPETNKASTSIGGLFTNQVKQQTNEQSLFQPPSFDQREGAISPLQLAAPQSDQKVAFTLNPKDATSNSDYKQSPAFGISTNKEPENEIKLTDKIPDLQEDKTIIKPVPVKPQVNNGSFGKDQIKPFEVQQKIQPSKEGNKEDEKPKDQPKLTQSLFETKPSATGSLFKLPSAPTTQSSILPNNIFSTSEEKGSLFDSSNTTTEQKKSLFAFAQTENKEKPVESNKPQESLFKPTAQTTLFTLSAPSNGGSLFTLPVQSQEASKKPEEKSKEESKPAVSLFTSSIAKPVEPEKKTLESKPVDNPLLKGNKTIENNPFMKPTTTLLSFGQVTGKQEDNKPSSSLFGQNQSKPKQPADDILELKATKSDMSVEDIKAQQIEIQETKPLGGGGLFGNLGKSSTQGSSLFGNQPATANGSSLFTSTTPTPGQSLFGGPSATPSGSSLFGQSASTKPVEQPKPSTSSLFNPPSTGQSLFTQTIQSAQTTTKSHFGNLQQPPQTTNSLFGQSNPQANGCWPSNSASGQSNLQNTQGAGSMFGQNNTPSNGSLFGQNSTNSNPFINGSFGQTAQSNPFGANTQGNPFFSGGNTGGQSLFVQNSSPQKPIFNDNPFGTPEREKEKDDGLFQFGSASKNASGKKKK